MEHFHNQCIQTNRQMRHHFIHLIQQIRTHPLLKTCRSFVHCIFQYCCRGRIIQLYIIDLFYQLIDLRRQCKYQITDTCDQFRYQHIDQCRYNRNQYKQRHDHSYTSGNLLRFFFLHVLFQHWHQICIYALHDWIQKIRNPASIQYRL